MRNATIIRKTNETDINITLSLDSGERKIDSGCPFVVVANKLDKLKKSEIIPNLQTIREDLELPEDCPVIPFSAEKGNGKDDLVRYILEATKR